MRVSEAQEAWTRSRRRRANGARGVLAAVAFALLASGGAASGQPAEPVDEDAVQLRMTPSDPVVRHGDVLTFEVVVVNGTDRDFVRGGTTGGVELLLGLPRGLLYREGSGRVDTVSGTTQVLLDPDQSAAELVLARDLEGEPQALNLGAGQTLRFRYQVNVSSVARAEQIARHTVSLRTTSGERLSEGAVAKVRVEADAELDRGLVLGRVFCDGDGDGRPGADEPGLGGVRVVADTGWTVDTDRDGRFHIRGLRPGMHLVKLDEGSLPPTAAVTGSPRRSFYVTRGLVVRADFSVRCPTLTEVAPTSVRFDGDRGSAGAEEGPPPADADAVELPDGPLPVVTVVGDVGGGALAVDARPLPPLAASLAIEGRTRAADGSYERLRARNVPWRPGPLAEPVIFLPSVPPETAALPGLSWRLTVAQIDGRVSRAVREFAGTGAPPASVRWDGTEAGTTVSVLERAGLYEARLTVSDGRAGAATSAPVRVGASWGATSGELTREVVRANLFDDKMVPTRKLQRAVERAAEERAKTAGARILIEVHTDASEVEELDLTRTRRGAYNLATWAAERLGLKGDAVVAVGFGGTKPLRPNIGERNRAFNQRVEIAVLPAEDPATLPAPPVPRGRAAAWIDGVAVALEPDGSFVHTVERVAGRPIAVALEGPYGARRAVALGDGVATDGAAVEAPRDDPPAGEAAPPSEAEVDDDGAVVFDDGSRAAEAEGAADPADGEGASEAQADAAQPLALDPLRRFGGRPLREALGAREVMLGQGELSVDGEEVTAGALRVELPPDGMRLGTTRLFVPGRADPSNTVTINGTAVALDAEGRFGQLVDVPSGASTLVVESRDPTGHVARIERAIEVEDTEFFLLALADGVGGQVGARLQELEHYHEANNGSLRLAGRGALYAKGRISGTALARDLFITAHVDTTKQREFEAFYDQVIDPARDYTIFGDAAEDVQDAAARGPFYLLVEADKSKLELGNIRTGFRGVHLLRYDRALYGAQLDVDHAFAEGFDTRVKAFVSEDNRNVVRRHDQLRATGGSLYYLSSREIIAGSEQISLAVREVDTGMELALTPLSRDAHYRVDYQTGRVTFASPVSSTMDALFQIDGFQPFTGRGVLDGHEVWIVASYESRAVSAGGDLAWGAHASQTLFGVVEVGGGYIHEGRPAGGGAVGSEADDYELYGAHVRVKLSERSTVFAELAESKRPDGVSLGSTDGGLTWGSQGLPGAGLSGLGGLGGLSDAAPQRLDGRAMKLGLDAHVGEIFELEDVELRVQGWWQLLESGFHAVGLAHERGTEKWGGAVTWKPSRRDRVDLRYDGGTTLVRDLGFEGGERAVTRTRVHGRYERQLGPVGLHVEGGFGQHRDDGDGVVHDTGAMAVGGRFRFTRRLTGLLSQEVLVGGDDAQLGDDFNDRMTTNVGLEYRLTDDLALRLLQNVRWNGDHATRFGLRTRLDESTSFYIEDRLQPGEANGRLAHALVFGAESVFGPDRSGRAYGEYRLDTGVGGRTNRAVVGIARRVELAPGVRLTGAYERSQAMSGVDAGTARDVISGGLEVIGSDVARFGGLYEVRLDRPVEGGEKVQAVVRNGLDVKLGDAVTLFGVFNYSITQNLDSRDFDKEDLEATAAIAWRPGSDAITLIARYSRMVNRSRSLSGASLGGLGGLEGGLGGLGGLSRVDTKTVNDLASLAAIIELPWRFQLTEKLAWRRSSVAVTDMPTASYDVFLWVNRLAFNLIDRFDLAGEFRMLMSLEELRVTENGGLVEVSYNFFDHARLGVGYSVNGVAGEVLPGSTANDVADGFYVRMTGTY